jgi:hypothetical protein
MKKENSLSPWGTIAAEQLSETLADLYFIEHQGYDYKLKLTGDTLWILAGKTGQEEVAFRTAFSPGNDLQVKRIEQNETGVFVRLGSAIGDYTLQLDLPDRQHPVLHYTLTLTPAVALNIPFWPRDIMVKGNQQPGRVKGEVHINQVGTRTGLLYISINEPKASSLLYLQNLTALNPYFTATATSAADTVSGNFPEIGFALPQNPDKFLAAGKKYTIADTFVAFNQESPKDQFEIAIGFTNLLSRLYLQLPRPETSYHDYTAIVENALNDIQTQGCWNYAGGHPYLNAYLSDFKTPPEIMVQLAVLLPVYDYEQWSGKKGLKIGKDLKAGLPAFFDEDLKTVVRWLPAAEDQLDESEEQKVPGVMDSWYLHHPLLNLSRMALNGDETAKELFLPSLAYARKVARHFSYKWPVFYKMDTLEVVKAETQPGEGGEKDVAGIYSLVMLQAYELTGEKKYLQETETAANTLKDFGFDIFYQANNTAFSAGAMLRLWKITRKERYLKLSYLLLANLFKNLALWSCEYGYGKNFPTFFSIFPLNDAPYTAVYEEAEVFSAIHDYFKHAEGEELLPSFSIMMAEFIRYLITRAVYYYPPMLPAEMLEEEIKTGELDSKLWVPLEDMHDGWEKSGGVGQEVYGAGLGFGIVPRHYIRVKNEDFMVYLDYPFAKPVQRKNTLSVQVFGSESLKFRLMIIKGQDKPLPKISVRGSRQQEAEGLITKDGHIEYHLIGNQKLKISW